MVGYQDETWWSRPAIPTLHAWAEPSGPLRLVERAVPRGDPDPEARSCYGLSRADTGGMLVRSVPGRPVSQVTGDDLGGVCERPKAEGETALLLIWDNASRHVSQRARARIEAHNRRAKADGGVRVVACDLPVKSPSLNPIEPKWGHGKKAIVEPDRLLTAAEVRERVRLYFGCDPEAPLVQHTEKKAA